MELTLSLRGRAPLGCMVCGSSGENWEGQFLFPNPCRMPGQSLGGGATCPGTRALLVILREYALIEIGEFGLRFLWHSVHQKTSFTQVP